MNITITDQDGNQVNATVDDAHWVGAAADACWSYLRAHGREGSATAREAGGANAGARICTVTYELHDE